MSLVVTGASGHLGRLTLEALLAADVPAGELVATARDVAALDDLGDRGVEVRRADFASPATLDDAFRGADRVMVVSTTTVGDRVDNHRRAFEAARRAGVSLIAYTSMVNADRAATILADTHRRSEQLLPQGGPDVVLLRNGWYLENYTAVLPMVLEQGVLVGAAGTGRVSAATRADYAAAAAAVLISDGHGGATYELGGEPFTHAELAEAIGETAGRDIAYQDLAPSDYASALLSAGLPDELATVLADADAGLARGELFTDSGHLEKLIGRRPTTMREVIRASVTPAGPT